jgi:hypothetical protein
MISVYLTLNEKYRAIGTPLEWAEAKTQADHVRAWGIEVRNVAFSSATCHGAAVSSYCDPSLTM